MVKIRFFRSGINYSQKGNRPKSSDNFESSSSTPKSSMPSSFTSPVSGSTPLRTLSNNTLSTSSPSLYNDSSHSLSHSHCQSDPRSNSASLSSCNGNNTQPHSHSHSNAADATEEIDSPQQHDGSDASMTDMASPNKIRATTTTRKVLNFFDSPRRTIFARTPKKKSRRLHHHPHQQKQEPPHRQSECYPDPDRSADNHTHGSDDRTGTAAGNAVDTAPNVLTWLDEEAPNDIVPRVLSFVGIHRVCALSLTNKSWRRTCDSEAVWRTLCEDTNKWVEGKDTEPGCPAIDAAVANDDAMDSEDVGGRDDRRTFWKRYYRDNPIVPLDYPTVAAALAGNSKRTEVPGWDPQTMIPLHTLESRSVRIFVVPGFYVVKERLMVDAMGDHSLTIETLEKSRHCLPGQEPEIKAPTGDGVLSSPLLSSMLCAEGSQRSSPTIRDRLSCCSGGSSPQQVGNFGSYPTPDPTQATIILKSRKKNEPVFHIRQGTLHISKIAIIHCCPGVDIWDGNAAVQIQPPIYNERPTPSMSPDRAPSAVITNSDIVSLSGRGVVAIDGGCATVRRSHVHHCAATGIYVGGPGSSATVETSDIVRNGNGNDRYKRGIARGHSGVYLEQGVAVMTDCNVSNNALTGISAVSRENAFLTVTDSDLMGNGSMQLELPPNGTESRRRCVCTNNGVATLGKGRCRSGLIPICPRGGTAAASGVDGMGPDQRNQMASS